MALKISEHLNQVSDPAARQALQALWNQLKSDLDDINTTLDAIKTAFDGHDHDGSADQAPIDSGGDDLTFTVSHTNNFS